MVDDDGVIDTDPQVIPRWEPLGEPGVGGRVTALAVDPRNADHGLVGGDLLGIAYTDDGGESWLRSDGLLGLEVSRITFHPTRPDEVWVGTMSGPHASYDGGRTWSPRRNGFPDVEDFHYSAPVEVVIVDNADDDRLLAFGGSHREWESLGEPAWGEVWESTDAGSTWARIGTIADGVNVVAAVQLDDGSLVAAALQNGIHRSTDGGRTWTRVDVDLPHGNVRDLAVVPGSRTIYAALGAGPLVDSEHLSGGLLKSTDGGVTWELKSDGLSLRRGETQELTSRYHAVAISPVDPETMWTADVAFGLEAVYRSDDGGESWRVELDGDGPTDLETAYSSPVTAEVIVPDVDSPELRYVAQSEYVLRRDPTGLWADATSIGTAAGRAGSGYSGLVSTDITFNSAVPGELSLNALDGGQLLRSIDDGKTWIRPLTTWDQWGGAESMVVAGPTGDHAYVLLGQFGQFNGIAASTDGQQTWTFAAGAQAGLPERFEFPGSVDDIVALDSEPTRVVATVGGGIYSSGDAGTSWNRTLDGTYSALVHGPGDELYVADDAGVYRLARTADEVVPLPGSPEGIDRMTVDPETGALYAIRWGVDDNTSGLITRWNGRTWTQLCLEVGSCGEGLDRYAADLAVDPTDPDHLVVATNDLPFHDVIGSRGVLESTDGGQTWNPLNDGLPVRRVAVVEFDPHRPRRLIIGTMGGGFYEMTLPE